MIEAATQADLPRGAPPLPPSPALLPVRMVNEYVYCPRLAYLEWVQGEWADSADTVEGRWTHRRVDRPAGRPPVPKAEAAGADAQVDDAAAHIHVHSLALSSEVLGIVARLDLAEFEGRRAVPVDYKRGKRPHVARGAYEPERVQLCAQALLLEAHGYEAPEGVLYFVASKERIRVPFDDALRAATREAVAGLRAVADAGRLPPPLENSPKCPRCSLAAICLPDELLYLRRAEAPPRPLAVQGTPALPMYVQARGAKVAKKGDLLEVTVDDEKVSSARLMDVSQLVLQGGVYLTGPALHELMARQIPVTWLSQGGWFLGHTVGLGHKNVELRTAQYRASFDDGHCLRIARDLVAAKIRNQRTLLRRNWKGAGGMPEALLAEFRHDIDAAERAHDLPQLLGIEGVAAARYFRHFGRMLGQGVEATAQDPAPVTAGSAADAPADAAQGDAALGDAAVGDAAVGDAAVGDAAVAVGAPEEGAPAGAAAAAGPGDAVAASAAAAGRRFDFAHRNRRPPTDPVNALLSYAYSLLARHLAVTLTAVGFDAYRGFYHQPRYGRPALALDMMEPFRPLLADSAVLTALNNGEVGLSDFVQAAGAVNLHERGRRAFIAVFERRLGQEVTHPLFGYSAQYRQIIELQCRLLGRHLLGEIDRWPPFVTR